MIRTQIQLTERQIRKLRIAAKDQGVSIAELVRRLIDRGIELELPDRSAAWTRAAGAVGRFRERDGSTDVSEKHDDYLDGAFE